MEVHGVYNVAGYMKQQPTREPSSERSCWNLILFSSPFALKDFALILEGLVGFSLKLSQQQKSMRGIVDVHTSGRNTSLGYEVDIKHFSPQNMQQDAQTLCCVLLKKMGWLWGSDDFRSHVVFLQTTILCLIMSWLSRQEVESLITETMEPHGASTCQTSGYCHGLGFLSFTTCFTL